MKSNQFSLFIEKYYHLLGLILYISIANFKNSTSYVDSLIIVFLFVFCIYRTHLQNKGKILDKDSLISKIEDLQEQVSNYEKDKDAYRKDLMDVASKLSIITQKQTINSPFKY